MSSSSAQKKNGVYSDKSQRRQRKCGHTKREASVQEEPSESVSNIEPCVSTSQTCAPRNSDDYIYNGVVIYNTDDEFVEGEALIIPIEHGRDTDEYRSRALAWFKKQYDLDIPYGAKHDELIFDGKARMQVWRTNPLYRMVVSGIDIQGHPSYQGKFPITNAFFKDDGYMILVEQEGFVVRGMFGNSHDAENGYEVPVGSFILYGEYRLFTTDENGNDVHQTTFQYESDCPVSPSPYPPYSIPVNCIVHHDDLGVGRTVGRSEFTAERIHTKYYMSFPYKRGDIKRSEPVVGVQLGDY